MSFIRVIKNDKVYKFSLIMLKSTTPKPYLKLTFNNEMYFLPLLSEGQIKINDGLFITENLGEYAYTFLSSKKYSNLAIYNY